MHRKNDEWVSLDREDIWDEFVNGNYHCFKPLFESYFEEMYGYGIKLCNRPSIVKDAIQDLFKAVWERRDDLDHIDSPNVYLFVSLRRKILKAVKRENKANGDLSEVNEDSFTSFSIEEIIITDEVKHSNKRELKEALNRLSDRQKEVIYLHYYNGMSYGEIQDILSIKRQSVRNHMYRGMQTLRELLDNEIMKLVISLLVTFQFSISLFL
ncbi:sigma-70 family RNA polymerase sigma factor [Aliifodinibius sp. S!AR15-10]|uniref:RNA polymerase sigma factor n=1 Tax=Aliifodinibius sp. S!AR15-10 TaxID=2950437 RepID=UPI00285A1FAA|nr:sigma-70 family RNA polymerase sigma factor [Aliifodinibius sp. S!AR15-10]MDR8390187.1 sigma-70 family RNA polymerase sigma factor [Aliifodinibius sp. S!AR15-10]